MSLLPAIQLIDAISEVYFPAAQGELNSAISKLDNSSSFRSDYPAELPADQTAFQEEVLVLHQELETELDESTLEGARNFLRDLEEINPGNSTAVALQSLLLSLFSRAGDVAFSVLTDLMNSKGVTWADPPGLLPTVGEREILAALDRRAGEKKRLFLSHSVRESLLLLDGALPDYYSTYPPRESAQWVELGLLALAEGIRACEFRKAIEILDKRRLQLLEALKEHVKPATGNSVEAFYFMLYRMPLLVSAVVFNQGSDQALPAAS